DTGGSQGRGQVDMLATDQLVLDPQVSGSLGETLVLRGSMGSRDLLVFFSAEILEHWPAELQRQRLDEMMPFIEGAITRALAARRYTVVSEAITGDREACVIVLAWMDIAS
ncbi:MAG TPA: hypothetical protein VM900_13650, partial [Sphingomonas sp.]|nr:hypothetical protein [Sphingomonas sp.]